MGRTASGTPISAGDRLSLLGQSAEDGADQRGEEGGDAAGDKCPSPTGSRGKLLSRSSTLYLLPAIAPTAARTSAMTTAHTHIATPWRALLNRAIRPATYPPQK